MRAIAKDDLGYPEYPYVNWVKGQEYSCELKDNGKKLDLVDEESVVFHFVGKSKENLSQVFDFVS